MTEHMDHETCSDLLHAFVTGRLDPARAASVQEHLDGCDRCRSEHRVLIDLLAEGEPLSVEESRTLRAAVLAAARRPAPLVTEITSTRPSGASRWRRLQVLAAAAVVIIGFVVVARIGAPVGGGDSAEVAGEAGPVAEVSDRLAFRRPAGERALSAPVPDAAPLEATTDQGAEETGTGGGGSAGAAAGAGGEDSDSRAGTAYRAGPPAPLYVRGAGALDDRRLRLVGRFGLPLVLFPRAYTVEDAARLEEDYLVALANAAETSVQRELVIECGAQVVRDRTVLPALATFGRYQGDDVLVLAFGWSESDSGPLDRFMVWTWPATDCGGIPSYRAGRIGV